MTRTEPPPPGIYPDVPEEEYRAWDAYNWSSLKRCAISMEQFKYDWDHPDESDTPAKFEGRMMHAFLADPKAAGERYVCVPAEYPTVVKAEGADVTVRSEGDSGDLFVVGQGRGKARQTWDASIMESGDGVVIQGSVPAGLIEVKMLPWGPGTSKFCQAWKADARTDHIITSQDVMARCKGMADRLLEIPDIQKFLKNAMHEVSVTWIDPQTNLACKARLDAWDGGGEIADAKSSARPVDRDSFGWTVKKFGYAAQAGMYLDGLRAALKAMGKTVKGVMKFHLWAIQNFKPYTPRPYHLLDDPTGCPLSYEWLNYGRQHWHKHLQCVAHSLETGEWPGHHHEGQPYPSTEELLVPENMKLEPLEDERQI